MRDGGLSVKIPRAALLDRLRENKEQHEIDFREAYEGYTLLVVKELEDKLARVREGQPIEQYVRNNAPVNYTSEYADAIDMLEMATDTEIELSQQQFRQYVKDDWGWKQQWSLENAGYSAAAKGVGAAR